jgi:hypothetical protein
MKLDKRFWIILLLLFTCYIAVGIFLNPPLMSRPFDVANAFDIASIGFKESLSNPVILIGLIVLIYFVYKKWR